MKKEKVIHIYEFDKIIQMVKPGSLATILILFGLILLLVGKLVEEKVGGVVPVFLTTLGVVFIVSMSISVLERHWLHTILESRFDLIDACKEVGIKQVYPKWEDFYKDELPERVEKLKRSFVAVGIALSGLSRFLIDGKAREIIDKRLMEGKKFTFCTVHPGSDAIRYRTQELGIPYHPDYTVTESLDFLKYLQRENSGCKFHIRTHKKIVPNSTIVCIDDEIIFASLYFSYTKTPVSYVVETRKGSDLFDKLKRDMDRILEESEIYLEEVEEAEDPRYPPIPWTPCKK